MSNHTLRKLTPDDLFRFQFIGSPVISTDGSKVAYTVSRPDADKNGYYTSIWVYDVANGESHQFTWGKGQENSPAWSPDGKSLAFLSDRGGDKQVWVMPIAGGEARQLTKVKNGLNAFAWSPDSKKVAIITKWDGTTEEKKDDKKYKSDTKVYSRIKYKFDGGGFWDHKWRHLWVVDVESGQHTQLTFGDCDDDGIAWSPDSKQIAFVSARFEEADVTNVRDLWAVDVESKELRQVVKGKGPISNPQWHPSGEKIGFIGHDNAKTNTTNMNIWVVCACGGEPESLTESADLSVGGGVTGDMHYAVGGKPWRWSACGKSTYFLANDHGSCHLYKVTEGGGITKVIADEGEVQAFDVCSGEVYFTFGDHYYPGDLFRVKCCGTKERLTSINRGILGEVELASVEHLSLKGADNWDIDGWLVKPSGFDSSKKYPLVLEIHGGPHSMFGVTFFFEFQLLAAKGFLVLFTNPRGSGGYGEVFTTACKGDWGGKDYEDLMLAVDHVIEKGFVDAENMGVTGGSYGGFMTNWVIGHTNRFKAAVTQRCLSNLYSFYGTSDIGFTFGDHEFPGNPWDNLDILLFRSPLTYVKNVVTPLLILHSEQDHRCPIEQGEQLFTALKKLKREVEFVRFPDEGHELSRSGKPHHRIERLERLVGWFDKRLER